MSQFTCVENTNYLAATVFKHLQILNILIRLTYIYPNLIIWPISFSISNCTHLVNVHIRCFVPQQQQQLITGSTGTLSLSLSFDDKSTNTNTLKNANTSRNTNTLKNTTSSKNTNTAQSRGQVQHICSSLVRCSECCMHEIHFCFTVN